MKVSLVNLLFKEGPGDFAGSDTFQGGPFGFGGQRQLAAPTKNEKLIDPAEEEKNHDYHMSNKLKLSEREASDIFYRDLPGNLPANALVNRQQHVPVDTKDEELQTNMSRVSLSSLLGSGKAEKHGYGPLKLNRESTTGWADSEGQNLRPIKQDGGVELVKKVNWVDDEALDPVSGFNRLNDEDDVNTRPGTMASISSPKKHVPGPAPVYEDKMKAKESKKLNDLSNKQDHIPSEKKKPKVTGSGLGSVVTTKDVEPSKKPKKKDPDPNEKLQPFKGSSEVLVDPESFTLIKEKISKAIKEVFDKQNKLNNK